MELWFHTANLYQESRVLYESKDALPPPCFKFKCDILKVKHCWKLQVHCCCYQHFLGSKNI